MEEWRSPTESVVDFARDPGPLPDGVLDTSRRLLMDTVGCALAGHATVKGRVAVQSADLFGDGNVATVIGGGSASLLSAAFANGELSNAIDMDAILTPGHVTPYIVAPSLAAAEVSDCTGSELLKAIAIGHEVAARVAGSFTPYRETIRTEHGPEYRLSAVMGYGSTIVGGALAAGTLLGLTREKLLDCLGGAGYMAPVPSLGKYLRLEHGPMTKYTSPGWVSAGAVLAARLAERGYTGDRTVLDGEYGLWRMFASKQCDWSFMLGGLGSHWHMVQSEFKPYPSFRLGHAGIEAFIGLLNDAQIDVEAIERVEVRVDSVTASPLYSNRDPNSESEAYISWPHVLAAAALHPPGPAWLNAESLTDSRVRNLRRKVDVVAKRRSVNSAEVGAADLMANPVTISVEAHGQVYIAKPEAFAKGHPHRPMTDAELEEKFICNSSWKVPQAQAEYLLSRIHELDSAESLINVFRAMRTGY